jgi:hypothetical protein
VGGGHGRECSQVAEVVAKVKGLPLQEVVDACLASTQRVFFPARLHPDAAVEAGGGAGGGSGGGGTGGPPPV